jgi:23S rRNA (guanosine2251-2'-O)-methyltransferase
MQIINGKRAVYEALAANAKIDRIIIDFKVQNNPDTKRIILLAHEKSIKVQFMASKEFFRTAADNNNSQGIIAYIIPPKNILLDDLLADMANYPLVLAVDHIQDPYNFGAILRTCETFNFKAVIYPKDRACQITPGVIKASSGAINYLQLVKVTNLAQSLEKMQKAGYWLYGTDVEGGEDIAKIKPNFPCVIVLGSEDKGMAQNIAKRMDANIHIPLAGKIESLNVSVATGIICYEFYRHYKKR